MTDVPAKRRPGRPPRTTDKVQPSPTEKGVAQPRGRKAAKEATPTRQQLSSVIKSVRDILRKDPGLSGETDRLPQLAWMLFLKAIDDHERYREELGEDDDPILEEPYRWRDWAAQADVTQHKTGDELLAFVNDKLMPYLASRSATDKRDLRAVIGTVFGGNYNRLRSGYLLRDVVNKISSIDFNSSDDIHTLSHFYESMLKEMRDAAGDSGEFYTPRPVIRFMIERLAPKPGEQILDPACGTGGFLVEGWEYLRKTSKASDLKRVRESLHGIEKKPMPYLLCVMNLLLHQLEHPDILEANALSTNIKQITDNQQVHVIATNPPFGGEEERGILHNFPEGMRTAETAVLFFQYVMAMLKRPGGRCGIILPNGFLFGGGIGAEVKRQLLEKFNLHTIVRLPNGTFAPYTSIPTNLLFFQADDLPTEGTCTKEIWYYEMPLPEGRKNYSKTRPLQYEEFGDCIAWWDKREENDRAWKVPVQQVIDGGYNLDIKNPNAKSDLEHLPPEELVESILEKERKIVGILEEIRGLLGEGKL